MVVDETQQQTKVFLVAADQQPIFNWIRKVADNAQAHSPASSASPRKGNQVLVVEDSRAIANMLVQSINALDGVACRHAETLASTRALLEEDSQRFYVAILDLNLPDAPDGEVVKLVQSYGVPVVVLTGSVDDKRREKLFKCNIADYIQKSNLNGVSSAVRLVERLYNNRDSRVLVVDDALSQRMLLETQLHNHGYQTVGAADGQEGLQRLDEFDDIRLVITDYNMPHMDGLSMVQKIRQTHSADELAIIGVSTVGSGGILPRFLKAGANDFLTKPYELEELYCRIDQNLDMLHYVSEARDAANRDFLTKLYNRRYFFATAGPWHQQALAGKHELVAAMIDADHFKAVNDTHGHAVGDEALIAIANALREASRGRGLLARFGGEEFVFLQILGDKDKPAECLEQLRAAIAAIALQTPDGIAVPLTVSIGGCCEPGASLDAMLAAADECVYQAKEAGRNRVVLAGCP